MIQKVIVAFTLIASPLWIPGSAKCEIVYDTLSGAARDGGGIVMPGFKHAGSVITLGGTSRTVTRLDVGVEAFTLLTASMDFKLNLWTAAGVPGELIWSSPVQHVDLITNVPTIVSVAVPRVDVPSTIGWTLEKVSTTGSPGLPPYPPATVGGTNAIWWEDEVLGWHVSPQQPSSGLGFRIIAVPEPATWLLTLLAIPPLIRRRG